MPFTAMQLQVGAKRLSQAPARQPSRAERQRTIADERAKTERQALIGAGLLIALVGTAVYGAFQLLGLAP